MNYINKFATTEAYEAAKEELSTLEHFVIYNVETNKTLIKPIIKENYVLINTNSEEVKLPLYTGNNLEINNISLSLGENKITNANYGWCFMGTSYAQTYIDAFNFANYNTSQVTNMNNMFYGCDSLTSLDVSSFDTSKVTDMGFMFYNCSSLTSLDVSNFDTSKVTDMSDMFYNCNSLTHIKCKQAFKDWCIDNKNTMALPTTMENGFWEIIG